MPIMRAIIFSCVLACPVLLNSLLPGMAPAQEWTRFHGPNGQGIAKGDGAAIPSTFTAADYNWRVKLPGMGHSSPVVYGDRVFLLSADPDSATRYMLCISAVDGKELWRKTYKSTPHHLHSRSSYASCTPAVDEKHVYVCWSAPEKITLLALTHEGEEAWEKDLGPWVSQHGFGASPIVYKNKLILHDSQQTARLPAGATPGKSYMLAFDRMTGQELWRKDRPSQNVCYSVPCIYQPEGGKPELVCCSTTEGVFSLDPETGEKNWGLDTFKMRTVASPIIAGGLIWGSTGSGGGGNYLVGVRPPTSASKEPELVHTIKSSAPYVPTPVTKGDLLFAWFDKGVVSCFEAESARKLWSKRVSGGYSGSPIRIGDRIFCMSEEGDLVVLQASKEFKLIGRTPLGEPTRATPAVSGGRLYLRTYSHLISVGGKST